jgi:putative ABC transport system permease protein
MRALDKKLLREFKRIWAQVLAIALVMASGVATFVLANGAYLSLEETREAYYERHRFADLFAEVTRAPRAVVEEIRQIPGIAAAEPRISRLGILDIEGLDAPATGRALSLPDHGPAILNVPYVRVGRLPERGRVDEVAVNEAFANAHRMTLGSTFRAMLNGKKRELRIVGIALSPEFIYAIGPGDLMPDDRRFAVLWMSSAALEAIFDVEGAFNEISVRLLPGAVEAEVLRRMDAVLARYGSTGAYSRKEQMSHAFLDAELRQLAALARVIPPIFLLVSAFLINITLSRLIALEREQIGLLKAIGYGRATIAWHYIKLVLVIALIGIAVGAAAGAQLGRGMTHLYAEFFHFPFLLFRAEPETYLIAAIVSAAAAVAGAVKAVREALALAPAVAMQPPAPPRYRRLIPVRYAWQVSRLSQLDVMAVRHMVRWPFRAGFTALGIALATALLVTALLSFDSVELMIDVAFNRTERQDATLALTEAKGPAVVPAAGRLPGVLRVEPFHAAPVRLRNGHLSRRLSITGKPDDRDLARVLDDRFEPVLLPETGLAVGERVAEVLGLKRGDLVEVELLSGKRRTARVPVTDIIKSYFGLMVYMRASALDELLDEGPRVSGLHVAYDKLKERELFAAIKSMPAIGSVALQPVALARFRETLAQNINYMVTVYVALAVVIAFGIVYNNARIQLSERARELASLRVFGFTRAEVSRVLLTELAILTLLAQPFGWLIGYGFGWLLIRSFSSDLYRVPFVIEGSTYAISSLVVLVAAAVSALIVRQRVDRLDLVAVLKTRD